MQQADGCHLSLHCLVFRTARGIVPASGGQDHHWLAMRPARATEPWADARVVQARQDTTVPESRYRRASGSDPCAIVPFTAPCPGQLQRPLLAVFRRPWPLLVGCAAEARG